MWDHEKLKRRIELEVKAKRSLHEEEELADLEKEFITHNLKELELLILKAHAEGRPEQVLASAVVMLDGLREFWQRRGVIASDTGNRDVDF